MVNEPVKKHATVKHPLMQWKLGIVSLFPMFGHGGKTSLWGSVRPAYQPNSQLPRHIAHATPHAQYWTSRILWCVVRLINCVVPCFLTGPDNGPAWAISCRVVPCLRLSILCTPRKALPDLAGVALSSWSTRQGRSQSINHRQYQFSDS